MRRPTRRWYLNESQLKDALRALEDYKHASKMGYEHDARAARETLLRMGAPQLGDGAEIELCLKPRILITTSRQAPKEN